MHSIDRHGLFVTGISRPPDLHDETKPHLLQGLPHGIILKSFSGTQYVMLPNYPMRRCKVKFCPFTVTTHPQPEDRLWQAAYVLSLFSPSLPVSLHPLQTPTTNTNTHKQTTYRCGSARTCVYEIHSSGEFVLYPSVLSALYWAYSKLAARQYVSAYRALESAGTDMPLSWAERTVIGMFKGISEDNHPDAHACRLKLRLAMIYAPLSQWPVGSEQFVFSDYINYLGKISHVSFACRLSFEDELHLMSHFRKMARKQKKTVDPIMQRAISKSRLFECSV